MAISDAFDELNRNWSDIVGRLSPEAVNTIRRALAAFVHGATWDPADVLRVALEGEPTDHPVWDALAATGTRRDDRHSVPLEISAIQLRFAIEAGVDSNRTREPEADVENQAEERILIAPMVDSGRVAEQFDVLVIPYHGNRLTPAFQFSSDGELLDHVGEINTLLSAADEPWGAASWWLSPHASLHGIPADLIRHDDPEAVQAAAAAASHLP